jgi:hypothetical protein
MSELLDSKSFRESVDKLNELWVSDKGKLKTEHDEELNAIAAANQTLQNKYERDRTDAKERGHLADGMRADANLARLAEKWGGEVDAENKRFEERNQAVDREFAKSVGLIEEGLSAIGKLERQHGSEREACAELMEEVESRPDVTAEKRVGDWVRTVGPVAEKAFNAISGYDVQVQWGVVGDATEMALGHARAHGLLLPSQNEFDQLMVKGVEDVQKNEMSEKNFEFTARLDALAEQIQNKLEQELGVTWDKDKEREKEDLNLDR